MRLIRKQFVLTLALLVKTRVGPDTILISTSIAGQGPIFAERKPR